MDVHFDMTHKYTITKNLIMSDESYDSVVIFDKGITIDDGPREEGGNGVCTIYGLLYNHNERHSSSPEGWFKNHLMYITYLMGCERLQQKGGDMDKKTWYLPTGKVVRLTYPVREFIYKTLLPELIGYRIMEFDHPIQLLPGENDKIFLLTQTPLVRLGVMDDIQNKVDNYEKD